MAEENYLSYHLGELKTELQQFINTRYELLRTELKQSASKVASAAVKIGSGAVLGLVGIIFCLRPVSPSGLPSTSLRHFRTSTD